MRIPFRVVSSRYREKKINSLSPRELTVRHAVGKAVNAAVGKKSGLVLGADTLVYCGRKILGKPRTRAQAIRMIASISGRRHFVFTGLALLDLKTGSLWTGCEKTKVHVKRLSRKDILDYISQVHPFDKAGGYAIQMGPKIVKKIDGSYSNVVGLPVEMLKRMLRKIGR